MEEWEFFWKGSLVVVVVYHRCVWMIVVWTCMGFESEVLEQIHVPTWVRSGMVAM